MAIDVKNWSKVNLKRLRPLQELLKRAHSESYRWINQCGREKVIQQHASTYTWHAFEYSENICCCKSRPQLLLRYELHGWIFIFNIRPWWITCVWVDEGNHWEVFHELAVWWEVANGEANVLSTWSFNFHIFTRFT